MKIFKGQRVVLITIILVFLITVIFFWSDSRSEENIPEGLFKESELMSLEPLQNQPLTLGYLKGEELNFRNSYKDVLKEEADIDVELSHYETYEEMITAAVNGELDLFLDMSTNNEYNDFYSFKFPIMNTSFVITNLNNPLGNMGTISHHHRVGFLRESTMYEFYEKDIEKVYFFDTMDEALNALENQEIDVFLTKLASSQEHLIDRRELQIEATFQQNFEEFELLTLNKDVILLLSFFEDIIKTDRIHIFMDKISQSNMIYIDRLMKEYIHSSYGTILNEIEKIYIGHHDANYPYSYFDVDGSSKGVYIDIMMLFQELTGITVEIINEVDNTNYNQMFADLNDNNLHFIFGIGKVHEHENIVTIGHRIQDQLITVAKEENKILETMPLHQINFGLVTSYEAAEQLLGPLNFDLFDNQDLAMKALYSGEVDALIGRRSTLEYYNTVLGHTSLAQLDYITAPTEHGIYGNVNNVELNNLLVDIQRLRSLIFTEDMETLVYNLSTNYENIYLELRETQKSVYFTVVGVVLTLIIMLVIKTHKTNKRLKVKSETDSLTGLLNKDSYEVKCKRLMELNQENLGAFFFFDMDNLKYCNDNYGHSMGDKLIKAFAEKLKKLENNKTICFRIAGDEFGLFSTGFNSKEEVLKYVAKIEQDLVGEIRLNEDLNIPIKFSGGGSIYNVDATDFIDLKQKADLAMYQLKHERKKLIKNDEAVYIESIRMYDAESFNKLSGHVIDRIINKKQIYAVFQGIISLESGEIFGYEGLTRTNDTSFSNIVEVIKLAHFHGRLNEFDLLMMETTIRSFRGSGYLFINMEYKSTANIQEYIKKMAQVLQETNVSISQVVIEVSEREQWCQETILTLRELKEEYQFKIAVDDFGAGFSNYFLLMKLKPDIVKVDRSLVCYVNDDKEKYEYLKILTDFIKKLNLKVIYEGIETIEELNILKEFCQDYGQGWYFEKPKRHDVENVNVNESEKQN